MACLTTEGENDRRSIYCYFWRPAQKNVLCCYTPTFGTQLSIDYFYTSMEHIRCQEDHQLDILPPEEKTQEVKQNNKYYFQNNQNQNEEEGKAVDSNVPRRTSLNEVGEEKENTPESPEKQIETVLEPVSKGLEENHSGLEKEPPLQMDKSQGQNIQKQLQPQIDTTLKLNTAPAPCKPTLNGPKMPRLPVYSRDDDEVRYFIGDDDDDDDYDQDNEDQFLDIQDSESSVDSDDEEVSDDSLPQDYDEEDLDLNEILGMKKSKGYQYTKQFFVRQYKVERKVLEEEEKKLKNYQMMYGINLPFEQFQLEKEALSQSILQFFNRNYLTYLELQGGKRTKKTPQIINVNVSDGSPPPSGSNEQLLPQKQSQNKPQEPIKTEAEDKQPDQFKEKEIIEPEEAKIQNQVQSQSSPLPPPSKRRVIFNEQINMKPYKEEEEVMVMNETEEYSEDLNNREKKPSIKKILPMRFQFLRKTNMIMPSQPKPVQISIVGPKEANQDTIVNRGPPQDKKNEEEEDEERDEGVSSCVGKDENILFSERKEREKEEQTSSYSDSEQNEESVDEPIRKRSMTDILIPSPISTHEPKLGYQESIKELMNSS